MADSRENPPGLVQLREGYPDLPLFLGPFQAEVFEAVDRLVVSPGIPLHEPCIRMAQERGVEVIGDIELFARAVGAPLVAITGSNGKSTVTSLVGEMAREAGLKVAVGGNLGEPALDLLADGVQLYVLELSSFQLETTRSLRATAAVVLNVSPDHMDRYADLDEYATTKALIYRDAETAVVNRDDQRVAGFALKNEKIIGFTLEQPRAGDFGLCDYRGTDWLCRAAVGQAASALAAKDEEEMLLAVNTLRIPGRHNLANALAALALGSAVGLPRLAMQAALCSFNGLPHRTQWVAEKHRMQWYNDSKGTNVGATLAALQGLHPRSGDSRTVLIAGGDCKGADFTPLAAVVEMTARAVILIGRDAPQLEAVLRGRITLAHAKTLQEAVALAVDLGRAGDRVLLSPACASFDMFDNFEARGEAFIQAVGALAA